MLYRRINGQPIPWTGEILGGVRHPLSIEEKFTVLALSEIGLERVVEADPVPDGKQIVSTSVQLVNNQIKYIHELEDIPPPSPDDFILTPRQLRLAIIRNGLTIQMIQNLIDNIPDLVMREETQIYWEYSDRIRWSHPTTQALIAMLGIPLVQAESMWLAAKDYEL